MQFDDSRAEQMIFDALKGEDLCERDLFFKLGTVERVTLHRLLAKMAVNGALRRYSVGHFPGPVVEMWSTGSQRWRWTNDGHGRQVQERMPPALEEVDRSRAEAMEAWKARGRELNDLHDRIIKLVRAAGLEPTPNEPVKDLIRVERKLRACEPF